MLEKPMFEWFMRFSKTNELIEKPKDKTFMISYPNRKVRFLVVVPAEPKMRTIGKQTRTKRIRNDITRLWRYVMNNTGYVLEISKFQHTQTAQQTLSAS